MLYRRAWGRPHVYDIIAIGPTKQHIHHYIILYNIIINNFKSTYILYVHITRYLFTYAECEDIFIGDAGYIILL